jgi:two-component system chemotaxis sensor kinase CheA
MTIAAEHVCPLAGLRDDLPGAAKYLSMFIDEARQSLDEITAALLAWEAGASGENLKGLIGAMHRLKGSAATIGLGRTAKLAHLAEDLLQAAIDGGGRFLPEVGDVLLALADRLRLYIDAIQQGSPDDEGFEELAEGLVAAGNSTRESQPGGREAETDTLSAPVKSQGESSAEIGAETMRLIALAVAADQHDSTLAGKAVFEPELPLVGLKAQLLHEKLSNLGNVCYFHPSLEELETIEEMDAAVFGLVTEKTPDEVRQLVRIAGIRQLHVEPLAASNVEPQPATATAPPASTPAKPAETLRVEVERLDQLMNLAGQMATHKSRLARIARQLAEAAAGLSSTAAPLEALREEIDSLGQLSEGVRRSAMDMRMTPIGPLLNRFHKVIRDLCRDGAKMVVLQLSGEDTELDKRMIDELCDPLIHLVRNAVDHGIEPPAERRAAGKPPQGTIRIEAQHRGGNVLIRFSDDGRGIDAERLRREAVRRGLLAETQAAAMDRLELLQLVWTPGLSTSGQVSEVSGRGMGMDIVRAKVQALNGAVALDSQPGRGTTFTIRLPLTLAVLPCLTAEIENAVYALPLESVLEIVDQNSLRTHQVGGRTAVWLRDAVLPVSTLSALFDAAGGAGNRPHWNGNNPPSTGDGETVPLLVVLGHKSGRTALRVDRVLGQEDVVIRSLEANYRHVPGIAGAGVLGDGRVCLILDPPMLIESVLPAIENQFFPQENAK